MNRKSGKAAVASLLLLGAGIVAPASAQEGEFDVTLEVLDDVSDVDAVVLRLEDVDPREQARERSDETGGRDGVDVLRERDGNDGVARELREPERDRERIERRETEIEERELERDFEEAERERERETDLETDRETEARRESDRAPDADSDRERDGPLAGELGTEAGASAAIA